MAEPRTSMAAAVLLEVNCRDEAEALRIAEAAIERRLAAAANHWPIFSVYRWKGEVVRGREERLVLKTIEPLRDRLQALVEELHSYEVPAISWNKTAGVTQLHADWLLRTTNAARYLKGFADPEA